MRLYYSPAACSMSPNIVAHELGLDVQLEKVDLKTHRTIDGGDYYAINPKGYVPALQLDDGSLLTEGPAIVQYLADLKPAAGLAPALGTIERYRLMETLNFISTELHKGFSPLFNPATPDAWRAIVIDRLNQHFARLEAHFATKDFVFGDRFSVADAYLFTVISWSRFVKVDISKYAAIGRYLERIGARPAVRRAMAEEGLIKAA